MSVTLIRSASDIGDHIVLGQSLLLQPPDAEHSRTKILEKSRLITGQASLGQGGGSFLIHTSLDMSKHSVLSLD